MDLSRRELLKRTKHLQSEAVKDCAESVKADNPDLSESQAFAICQSMENDGELSALAFDTDVQLDDPCWDGYVMVGTKEENGQTVPNCVPEEDADPANLADGCPDGQVTINGECVDVEEVDAPPSVVEHGAAVMAASGLDTEPIERAEEGESTVRYSNLSLLTEGVWTDQKSKTPTLYSEDGIAEIEARYDESEFDGPPVNVMHDVDPASGEVHEASHGGYVDPNSLQFSDGALMGDIVLDTSTAAGDFADENLQSALESNGRVGFGGPSVELDLDPDAHIQNSEHPSAEKEINGGWLTGLGLVMDPADKNVAFDKETRTRAVAMSSQTDKSVYRKRLSMSDKKAIRNELLTRELNLDNVEEEVATIADEYEGVEPEDVMEMLAPLMDMGGEEEAENADGDGDEEEMTDNEEEEDKEMMPGDTAVDVLEEQIDDLWDAIDEMKEQMMGEEQLSESLAEAKEELADAETVAELEEAKEALDKRLSELEGEPKNPRSLADGSSDEWEPVYDDTPAEQSSW